MSKFYIIADKEGEKMVYNKERLQSLTDMLYEGRYLVSFERLNPMSDIKEYRRCYFSKLDALAFEAGETRYAMHDVVKVEVLQKMIDETPALFNVHLPELSTKYLTRDGWVAFIKAVDLFAYVNYGMILQ